MLDVSFTRTHSDVKIEVHLTSVGAMKIAESALSDLLGAIWSEWDRFFDSTRLPELFALKRPVRDVEPQMFDDEQDINLDGLIDYGRKVKVTISIVGTAVSEDMFCQFVGSIPTVILSRHFNGATIPLSSYDYEFKNEQSMPRALENRDIPTPIDGRLFTNNVRRLYPKKSLGGFPDS